MKKRYASLIALLLIVTMLASALAACTDPEEITTDPETVGSSEETTAPQKETTDTEPIASDTDTESASAITGETESSSVSESETKTETPTETETEPVVLEDDDAALIQLADRLANKSDAYYGNGFENDLVIENSEMRLHYPLEGTSDQGMLVAEMTNRKGNTYLQDTMDVFVKMKNGGTYYASASMEQAIMNIYRFGYYYYENRIEGQVFVGEVTKDDEKKLSHTTYSRTNGVSTPKKFRDGDISGVSYTVESSDPYIVYDIGFSTAKYDYLELTIRAENVTNTAQLFVVAGSASGPNEKQSVRFSLINDGEFHTYQIPLNSIPDYNGSVRQLRLDIDAEKGSEIKIAGMTAFKANAGGAPTDISLQRSFLTYSDKMHHIIQISAAKAVEDIEEIGMLTELSADTVDKLIVKDKNGLHETLDGVDWDSAEYVGFDIKGAGIFGYILPCDNGSGKLTVTLADGVYSIVQSKAPIGSRIEPSKDNTLNANDFFMGQRVYTDSNHTFDEFLHEAACERNPLAKESFTVNVQNSDSASYSGYDALRGYYKFTVRGTDFNNAYYNYPNKHFAVNFTVKGDEYDRQMYFMTFTSSGNLESAALLNSDMLLLPVPLEVAKNFKGDGENTIYNLDDAAYGEVYFPMVIKSGEEKEYTLLNLYQNWGRYPLKQISSIQFHMPYYHLSLGTTETNCIVPFVEQGPRLPDHRAISAPLWKGQPQHTSAGDHIFLSYTTEGSSNSSRCEGVDIDSYGPTYADVTMYYEGNDGKISATYTHTEMPQDDENRGYYEMTYTFNEDTSFEDFKKNVTFYNVGINYGTGRYAKVGYLDENNQSKVAAAATGSNISEYILGDQCPYFSFFELVDYDTAKMSQPGYVNLSLLIYNYEIIQNGEKIDTNFLVRNRNGRLYLTLNLGEISFKAGDSITLNCIIMPWGSEETDYSAAEPDKNVREVRKNSLLDPIKATADRDCEVIESVFVPKLLSTNGKSAEFTVSGGHNNVAIRVYGFEKLTAPKIEEYVNGEWVEYAVSSAKTPDSYGNAHHYDGYMVHYDSNGTYSYSFVTTIDNGAPRKFRISADEDFAGWPEEEVVEVESPTNVYVSAKDMFNMSMGISMISKAEFSEDGSYVRYYGNSAVPEAYFTPYKLSDSPVLTSTGRYAVIKYRLPKDGSNTITNFEFFTSSVNQNAKAGDELQIGGIVQNGEWQVMIIDLAAKGKLTQNGDGTYLAKYFRMDFFNGKVNNDMYIDLAYFAMDDSLETIYALNKDMASVTLINGTGAHKIELTQAEDIDLSVYIDAETIYEISMGNTMVAKAELLESNTCARYHAVAAAAESYFVPYTTSSFPTVTATGRYVAIKYRLPKDGSNKITNFEFFTSSVNNGPTAGDELQLGSMVQNGEWQVWIIDLAGRGKLKENADGSYHAKYFRWDFFNGKVNADMYIDISYIAMDDDLDKLYDLNKSMAAVTLINASGYKTIDPKTGEETTVDQGSTTPSNPDNTDSFIDAASTMKKSTVPYGFNLDMINGMGGTQNVFTGRVSYTGSVHSLAHDGTTMAGGKLVISGWAAANGGIEKYVWSADGGKTWQDCVLHNRSTIDAAGAIHISIINGWLKGAATLDAATSTVNGVFQCGAGAGANCSGIAADLSAYMGQTVDVTFAAVPKLQADSICIILHVTGVTVSAD